MNSTKEKILSIDDLIRVDNLNRYIQDNHNGNVRQFGKSIGLKDSQITNLTNSLAKIRPFGKAAAYTVEKLIGIPIGALSKINCKFNKSVKNDMVSLPIYQNNAATGKSNHLFDDDHLMDQPMTLPRTYLLQHGANPNTTVGLIASGKSMQDKIKDGAIVFIDKSQKNIVSGEIYCFLTNKNKRQIKYLIEGINGLIIHSENPTFQDEIITQDSDVEIEIDGKVVFIFNPA